MRILVAALGSPGHSFPLVPLALALRDAGHEVVFATGPEMHDAVAAAGLEVVVAGGSLRDAFRPALARHGLTARPRDEATIRMLANEVFGADVPRGVVADLGPWVETHRPDLVIAESADPGAALVAARAGIACVTHSFGRRPPADVAMGGRASAPVLEVAAELGVGAFGLGDPLGHAYLDICPPSMQSAPTGVEGPELALRPTAWNPPIPGFVAPSGTRPWVYLTLGTAMGDAGVLRAAARGLARLDVDVLVAAGSVDAGELSDLSGDLGGEPGGDPGEAGAVRVEPFVPQADLLAGRLGVPPALVVHHGGSGTTLAAAAAGVPQLLLPQGADQFVNAAALAPLGLARALLARDEQTADALVDTARDLLGDVAAHAAVRDLAAEIAAMPPPADLAATVGDWGRPPR